MNGKLKKSDNNNQSNQSFIMLYTCLSLLLLCFFVFLVANSVVDPDKKKEAIGSLIGAFGFFTGGISPTGDIHQKQLGFSKTPLSKDTQIVKDIIEIVSRSSIKNFIIIKTKNNSILLNFKKGGVFKNNNSNINQRFLPVLLRIYYKVSSAKNLKVNITGFHNYSFLIASERAFNLGKFFHNKGIDYKGITAFGKLHNNNIVANVSLSGYVYGKQGGNSKIIKEGDFIFKVD